MILRPKTLCYLPLLTILINACTVATTQPKLHTQAQAQAKTQSQSAPANPLTKVDGLFKMVTEGRIATDGGLSRGVAWGDYDNDGDPDLYVANSDGQWNALYQNQGQGNFQKVTGHQNKASETVIHGGNSQGVSWIDYDNDGDLDLLVVGRTSEPNLLFRNDNAEGFTRLTDHVLADTVSASMACWADYDGDGDIDLFLAGTSHPNAVYNNLGHGQFERLTSTLLTSNQEGRARACSCGDANNDGLPELYVANARIGNEYYRNLGNWEFEKVQQGHLVQDIGYSYGASWADYDDDGFMDLFLANFDKENYLYHNDGQGNLIPLTRGSLALEQGGASKGHTWGDYDHDTDLDLFIANGTYGPDMRNFLYLNQGDGTFERDIRGIVNVHADTSAGAAHADFDGDGDLDLFVANWGSRDQINRLYENIRTEGNWVTLRLNGTESNRFGIGTKVIVYLSKPGVQQKLHRWLYPITGFGSHNDYELHFGLGDYQNIDSLVVYWPKGSKAVHKNLSVNQHLLIDENHTLRTID